MTEETTPNPNEETFAFIVFDSDRGRGVVTMHDQDFSVEMAEKSLRKNVSKSIKIVAALTGLTSERIAMLNVIFDNVDNIRISTKDDLEKLLRFSFSSIEYPIVQKAISEASPAYISQMTGDTRQLATLAKLFELYAALGGVPASFEAKANNIVAEFEPEEAQNCLMLFQIILHRMQPEIKRKIEESN